MAKKRSQIVVFPTEQYVKGLRRTPSQFKPHDLRSLIADAQKMGTGEHPDSLLAAYRARNSIQLDQLLLGMGVNPSLPEAWYPPGVGRLVELPGL